MEIRADWSSAEGFSVRVEQNGATYPLEEVIFYIGEANLVTDDSIISGFWGLEDDDIYEIPDSSASNDEFAGFILSRDGNIGSGIFDPNVVEWKIIDDASLDLPVNGHFLMATNQVHWDTEDFDEKATYSEDGANPSFFWAFTEPGLYSIPFELSGTVDGELKEGGPFYLHFYVDPPDVAPWQRWAVYSLGAIPTNDLAALEPLETFSGSGVMNLLSYAFDIPLGVGTNGSLLPQSVIVEDNGDQYLGISFREPEGNLFAPREDLEWVLEGSTDLDSWDKLDKGTELDFQLLSDGLDEDGVPRKIARLNESLSESSRRFLRLRFELTTEED
ncbi:MAG: hypothetical protein LAT55_04935 [Opitutales bacterium]|nr:hypothetical protein [Opitutales bacterium]